MCGATKVALAVLLLFTAAGDASAGMLTGYFIKKHLLTEQQRLSDAKCYSGPIDGNPSPALEQARKACPDQQPMLRIETGMHTALIKSISVDSACTMMATASDDKTVRVWSLPDGNLLKTVRLPINNVDGGKVYTTALSPDGRWLAAGGWDAANETLGYHGLYITDLSNGTVRRLGKFTDVIFKLAFSPDGRRIAVALAEKNGIRVLDVASGNEIMADKNYGNDSYGLAFTADGGLLASSYDGYLRRYWPDLMMATKMRAPDGSRPHNISISPSGSRIGLGYADTTSISILDAKSLNPLAKAETGDVTSGNLFSVAWSRDGKLWAGGRSNLKFDGVLRNFMRSFLSDGSKSGSDVALSDDTIMNLQPCMDGIAFGTGDPAFGLVTPNGTVTTLKAPITVDMKNKLSNAFTASADGMMVRFGLGSGAQDPVVFDLAAHRLSTSPSTSVDFLPAKANGLKVTNWKNKTDPALDGKPIGIKHSEISRSLAIRPKTDGFVMGGEWYLRSYDANGIERWHVATPASARGVNFAQNGDMVIAAISDGTIRWYRWSDGKELLALFVYKPDLRWVAWTPTGYYMASPGSEDLIGWHVNRGWEQPPDFFPASRFRNRFNRPDVVQKVLTTLDEDKAVAEADAEAHRKPTEAMPIEAQLPPVIRILSPKDGSTISGNSVTLDYTLRSPSGLPVEAIDVMIDGRPLAGTRGVERADEAAQSACPGLITRNSIQTAPANPTTDVTCHITVPLSEPSQSFEIGLVARSGKITSEPALVKLIATSVGSPSDVLKPKLYILSIGISDYTDPTLKLGYAAKDAADFAKALDAQQGGMYSTVVKRVLANQDANREAVLDGLDWLEHEVTSRDVAMVFLAGHGTTDEKGNFWYLPADVRSTSLRATAVSQDELRSTLQSLPSKAVLFLDTCHAGKAAGAVESATRGVVDVNSLVNDLTASENGVVTFASSTGRELSEERDEWGHGAFTKALLEGISDGKADVLHQGNVTLSGLDVYITERVKELTHGQQHPVMMKPATITNFSIAVVGKY